MLNFGEVHSHVSYYDLPVQKEEAKESFKLTSGELLSPHLLLIGPDKFPTLSSTM